VQELVDEGRCGWTATSRGSRGVRRASSEFRRATNDNAMGSGARTRQASHAHERADGSGTGAAHDARTAPGHIAQRPPWTTSKAPLGARRALAAPRAERAALAAPRRPLCRAPRRALAAPSATSSHRGRASARPRRAAACRGKKGESGAGKGGEGRGGEGGGRRAHTMTRTGSGRGSRARWQSLTASAAPTRTAAGATTRRARGLLGKQFLRDPSDVGAGDDVVGGGGWER
jgi:hypothetical protein